MKKTLCYSVRVKTLTQISAKCCIIEDWQGNKDLIPESQIFGYDTDVKESDAYWISKFILSKKKIIYSHIKQAWFKSKFSKPEKVKKEYDETIIETHIPKKIDKEVIINKDLLR